MKRRLSLKDANNGILFSLLILGGKNQQAFLFRKKPQILAVFIFHSSNHHVSSKKNRFRVQTLHWTLSVLMQMRAGCRAREQQALSA